MLDLRIIRHRKCMTNLRNKYVIKAAFENDYYYFLLRNCRYDWNSNAYMIESTFYPTKIIARIIIKRALSRGRRAFPWPYYDMLLKATVIKPLI